MQNALERRKEILDVMNIRRHDTVSNLAFEFGVSEWTIRRDILLLSVEYPVYCLHGGRGGVHFEEGYSAGRKLMSDKQAERSELRLLVDPKYWDWSNRKLLKKIRKTGDAILRRGLPQEPLPETATEPAAAEILPPVAVIQ